MAKKKKDEDIKPPYIPTGEELEAKNKVMKDFIKGRSVVQKNYNQFDGRNLYDAIDDWTKRWNGHINTPDLISIQNPQSQVFLNFTRNAIIAFVSKVAMDMPTYNIYAVNKKNSMTSQKMSEISKDLITYSDNAENGQARFTEVALEGTIKGTAIVYEGYAKNEQEWEVADGFDMMTGKGKFKKETRTIFDGCFQKLVPIEDFFIANPYQPDIQKQPFLVWREITTYDEAYGDYGHYENFEYVKPGTYVLLSEPTTFYRNDLQAQLAANQVEVLKYYNRRKNKHIVTINGVVIYNGPIPFKDGKYPFAKFIFEPYGNDFFWGMGFPQKIMGEQDLANVFYNMMVDKTEGSLLPFGLSSDLDDLIDDDALAPNKIRKVSDVNKWKFDTLPGVSPAEQNMLQMTINFFKENSGDLLGAGTAYTPKGGKLQVRQVMLRQQEAMQKLTFSMNYLEDFVRDRVELRLHHIFQFFSIPKIEKITGKSGKEIEQLMYRDIKLTNTKLSDGQTGTKIIKIQGSGIKKSDNRKKMEDDLSVLESMGEESGIPTEALAISIDTFEDFNYEIEIVRNSSYEKNQLLDQAARQEFANWRLSVAQVAPVDATELVKWVEESYDIDIERFKPKPQPGQQQPGQPGQPEQPGQPGQSGQPPQGMPQGQPNPQQQMMAGQGAPKPSGMGTMRSMLQAPNIG